MKYFIEVECKKKNLLQIIVAGLQFFFGWFSLWAIACVGGVWYLLRKFKKAVSVRAR